MPGTFYPFRDILSLQGHSVPLGTEFKNDHECEARGINFSLGPSAQHEGSKLDSSGEGVNAIKTSGINPPRCFAVRTFRNSVPTAWYRIKIFCPSGVGGNIESSPGVIISGDRIRDRTNILSKQRQIWHRGSIPLVFIYITCDPLPGINDIFQTN